MLKILRSLELDDHVFADSPSKYQFDRYVDPVSKNWKRQDEMLGYWLMSCMSGFDTAREAWISIKNSYASWSRARTIQIKEELITKLKESQFWVSMSACLRLNYSQMS